MSKEFENLYIENSILSLKKKNDLAHSVHFKDILIDKVVADDGEYISFTLPGRLFMDESLKEDATAALCASIKDMLKKYKIKHDDLILVVGIGNAGMTADALGARALGHLEITEHLFKENYLQKGKGRLACVAGSVSGVTGLNSFDIIKGVIDRTKPKFIIAIDTLASKKTARLQRVIQLSDKGITPGSGVNNAKRELSLKSLGVPLVAIGVPLVIYARNIVAEYLSVLNVTEPKKSQIKKLEDEFNSLVVTVKEIDVTVDDFASVIGKAINNAVHSN